MSTATETNSRASGWITTEQRIEDKRIVAIVATANR